MSIVIIGDNFTFPEGNAATNRVYTYARGFIENNVNASVISFRNDYMENRNGTVERIQYFHPINQKKRNKYFAIRNWFKLVKYINTIILIRKINREDKVSAIIIYTKALSTHLFSYFLARLIGSKLIIENSEHPLRDYQSGNINKVIGRLKFWIKLKTFDGILLITKQLIDFYKKTLHDEKRILLVPSTVDPKRFTAEKSKKLGYKYIGYFGSINFRRDNVDVLINAFASICDRHKNIDLVLGGMMEVDKNLLTGLINTLKIESRVHILGYLSRNEITQYIIDSHILVLVRSNDKFTEVSFPSKLTEYLATGNPVIATAVSEIAQFITDNNNGFLIKPGSTEELIEKMEYILNNYEVATEVARKGKALTDNIFNNTFQAKQIIEFIETL